MRVQHHSETDISEAEFRAFAADEEGCNHWMNLRRELGYAYISLELGPVLGGRGDVHLHVSLAYALAIPPDRIEQIKNKYNRLLKMWINQKHIQRAPGVHIAAERSLGYMLATDEIQVHP